MNRKISLFAMMGLMAIMSLFAQNVQGATIPLTVNAGGVVGGGGSNQGGDNQHPRSPRKPLVVNFEAYTLDISCIGFDFTLQLIDADENVVFSTFVIGGTPEVTLPTYLEGEYELRLVTEDLYYYGYIEL